MKKKVINLFKKHPGSAFKNKEVAKKIHIKDPEDYSLLKATLYKLYEDGFLVKKGKRYKLNTLPESNRLTGVFQIHPDGYGFVTVSNKKIGDIFIAERHTGTAFDGDKVEVLLFAKQKGKNLAGQITRIIERKRREIIGTLHKSKSFYYVTPDSFHIHRDIYIDKNDLNNASVNEKVIVGEINWDSSMHNPEGIIKAILGEEGSHKAEIASLANEFNLPVDFPAKVLDESNKIELVISDDELRERLDLRDDLTFTIDPVDAKDFDDALSIRLLDNGNYEVGVHIADVSHYIKKDSALDVQAKLRGNSVYLVGHVIPMLPEKLSNGICSLVPGKDRLTYSIIFEITLKGKVVKYDIVKTVIKSKRRFTYKEAQQIIETDNGHLSQEINWLNNLAGSLRKARIKAGSIEFFTPEVSFELDESGKPLSVTPRVIKESNMLVEEFMLLANRTIAEHFSYPQNNSRNSMVYRIHEKPELEKLDEFSQFIRSLGYSFNSHSLSDSKELQKLISQVKGSEEEAVVNELAIRSMAKAVYSVSNTGHFGLGFKYYTHFTSPIRRYADLLTHRMIHRYMQKKDGVVYSLEQLEEICDHISACERTAVTAERQSVKMKQIDYLKDRLGEQFHAVISGVMSFGIFIKITDILAEGLIRVGDLEGDFYVYDEKKYALIGRHTKKRFRLGDKLTVKLVRVDQDQLELDFITVD
ncbi:MAG: ribonuclease R [Ignavibacteria bacterium]|jgi:ribonuclease R